MCLKKAARRKSEEKFPFWKKKWKLDEEHSNESVHNVLLSAPKKQKRETCVGGFLSFFLLFSTYTHGYIGPNDTEKISFRFRKTKTRLGVWNGSTWTSPPPLYAQTYIWTYHEREEKDSTREFEVEQVEKARVLPFKITIMSWELREGQNISFLSRDDCFTLTVERFSPRPHLDVDIP